MSNEAVSERRDAWLERAQQLRQIAVDLDDPVARQDILEVAARWAAKADPAGAAIGHARLAPDPTTATWDVEIAEIARSIYWPKRWSRRSTWRQGRQREP